MKRLNYFLITSLVVVMASCSLNDSAVNPNLLQSENIANLEENYETALYLMVSETNNSGYLVDNEETAQKGYSVAGPIIETKSSEMCEEAKEFFAHIQNVLDGTYSKTNVVSTRAYTPYYPGTGGGVTVGILKKTTCGSYPEFHYHQDNQDGGWTYVSNNIGATYADGNKNMEWRFCVVPGDYNRTGPTPYDMGIYSTLRKFGGGVLLLSIYHWTSADGVVHVYRRYHDDEDSGNANKITSSGGLIKYPGDYIGASLFSNNTGLTWIFAGDANDKHTGLGFDYGVIAWSTSSANTIIGIDDENTKNKNWAKWTRHTTSATPDFEWDDQNFAGIVLGNNNTYYYVKYF